MSNENGIENYKVEDFLKNSFITYSTEIIKERVINNK
jgi:DNA gyrase/topoisomerase IV subunit A